VTKTDTRRALRIQVNLPTALYAVGQPEIRLHTNLARVYERIKASRERIGERLPGVIQDLSTNGAFVASDPLPLLSRVALGFEIDGHGPVEALGWVLWRRVEDCSIPRADDEMVFLPKGFGVLFESVPLDARLAIHRLVERAGEVSA
jgi:hypothetical protein